MTFTPTIVGIIVAIVAMLLMYVESKVFDNPKTKMTYFKNMILCGGLSALVVYFMGGSHNSMVQYGGSAVAGAATMAGRGYINGEEIMTGSAPF